MIGYLLIGILAGLAASVFAAISGATFWGALGAYALGGFAVMVILPVVQIALGALRHYRTPSPARTVSYAAESHAADGSVPALQSDKTAQDLPQPAALRILAVDDEPLILDLIPMIAAESGFYDVTSASSGKQALTLLNKADKPFECLLLDIKMPGINGIELCKHIRQMEAYQDTPIIMLTALRDAHNMAEAFQAGATSYITKPFDIEELCQRLELAREMMHGPQQAVPGPRRTAHKGLIDLTALSSYLTQLPRNSLDAIQVFAINVDPLKMADDFSSDQRKSLMAQVAEAAAKCFDADHTVMASTGDNTLLVATSKADGLLVDHIETQIAQQLDQSSIKQGRSGSLEAVISVGGPVQLLSSKEQRAAVTIHLAMRLVEDRMLAKQGQSAIRSTA